MEVRKVEKVLENKVGEKGGKGVGKGEKEKKEEEEKFKIDGG